MPASNKKTTGHKLPKELHKFRRKFSWKTLIIYACVLLFVMFAFAAINTPMDQGKTVPISQIVGDVKAGNIKQITVNNDTIIASGKNGSIENATNGSTSDIYTFFKNTGVSLTGVKVNVQNT